MHASIEKPLFWIGSSKKDLMALPIDVRKFFGHALDFAQSGIATPKQDGRHSLRLKAAEALVKELRDDKTNR